MIKTKVFTLFTICLFLCSCTNSDEVNESQESDIITNPTNKVVPMSTVKWEALNPARGDKSPKAGTLWGNRNGVEPTGFLVQFVDGFSSPPHIHNVTYRALVISGEVHNDDPNAANMWMPQGSFWTQPAGETHITSARGTKNIAYVEIDKAPYLVKPTEEAFDNGERPINIHSSNIVWTDCHNTKDFQNSEKPQIAFLWENKKEGLKGTFLKIPTSFQYKIKSNANVFKALLVQGTLNYKMPNQETEIALEAGSHFSSEGNAVHEVSGNYETNIIYIRSSDEYTLEVNNH